MLRLITPLIGGMVLLAAGTANSAIVTQFGDNVKFTYNDATLFGAGTVIGDNIFFLPTEFIAESLNGAGLVSTSETLAVQVEVTTAGFWLTDFAVAEQGDYQLVGAGATVDVGGHFMATSNTSAFTESKTFSAGPLTVQNALTQWELESVINLSDTSGWGSDTDVSLELYNLSEADTAALGEEAFVQKKLGGVGVMVSAIPVPAAVWLFGSGLLALVGWGRAKRAA